MPVIKSTCCMQLPLMPHGIDHRVSVSRWSTHDWQTLKFLTSA
jgi:hypothetical protein